VQADVGEVQVFGTRSFHVGSGEQDGGLGVAGLAAE